MRSFSKAADLGFQGGDPAAGVEKFPEASRERFLQADELQAFFVALDREPSDTLRDFFYLALWTGARRSNVQAMKWGDLNLDMCVWCIPPDEAKGGKPILVPARRTRGGTAPRATGQVRSSMSVGVRHTEQDRASGRAQGRLETDHRTGRP